MVGEADVIRAPPQRIMFALCSPTSRRRRILGPEIVTCVLGMTCYPCLRNIPLEGGRATGFEPAFAECYGGAGQRPPAPKRAQPTQLGAAGDCSPSFFLRISQLGATATNCEPLRIVTQLSPPAQL
jgi:hypothetical protein